MREDKKGPRARRASWESGAVRLGFLSSNYPARFHKLLPLSKFENHLDFLLERECRKGASMLLLVLNDLADVGVVFHGLNRYSLSSRFFVKLCRFKTA